MATPNRSSPVSRLTALDYALIAAALGVGVLMIEQRNRIEVVAPAVAAAPAPKDECALADARYGASRLMFFEGGFITATRNRQAMIERFSVPPGCGR